MRDSLDYLMPGPSTECGFTRLEVARAISKIPMIQAGAICNVYFTDGVIWSLLPSRKEAQ